MRCWDVATFYVRISDAVFYYCLLKIQSPKMQSRIEKQLFDLYQYFQNLYEGFKKVAAFINILFEQHEKITMIMPSASGNAEYKNLVCAALRVTQPPLTYTHRCF